MSGIWGIFRDALLQVVAGDQAGGVHANERGESNTPLIVRPASERTVVHASPPSTARLVVAPTPRTLIEKVKRPVWEEKGWTSSRKGTRTVYEGFFEVVERRENRRRRFGGAVSHDSKGYVAYIADPPPEIQKHPKGPCFALLHVPWFRVHWRRAPKDVDNAILYVETVLDEALNR